MSSSILLLIGFILAGGGAIPLIQRMRKMRNRQNQQIQEAFSKKIMAYLLQNSSKHKPLLAPQVRYLGSYVSTLEKFDRRIRDPSWLELKEEIFEIYLKSYVQAYANSRFEAKRELAARCYTLCPEKADEKQLAKFLQDSALPVQAAAIKCILQTSYPDLFASALQKMSKNPSLFKEIYPEAFLHMTPQKIEWIEKLLKSHPSLAPICHDLLSLKSGRGRIDL